VPTSVRPTAAEVARPLPGDELVPSADVVMDRAFSLPAPPAVVWPWLVQLGLRPAGWSLPRCVEAAIPPRRRALRRIAPTLQRLTVGDVIPDWGGAGATFEVAVLRAPEALVHRSTRGKVALSWALVLAPEGSGTRVALRLRLGGVRRPLLARTVGGSLDLLTVVGLAAGLRERVA
jgi:hypothetical protein